MDSVHSNYINDILVPEIVTNLKEKLVSYKIEHSSGLDGFMSALYTLCLKTESTDGVKERSLMVKLMKGDAAFRESSKSYIQFANEIYIYDKVLPAYNAILKESNLKITVDKWVPRTYAAKFGYIEGLSTNIEERDSVLVLENLKPRGYKLGPRVYLNCNELANMARPLGQYHALSYVVKIQNENLWQNLISGIVPLPFIDDDSNKSQNNLYQTLYRVAFDRFYDFIDRKSNELFDTENDCDIRLKHNLQVLREKYFDEPTKLLESIRTNSLELEEDKIFAAILHGDFNRNNVLFQYKRGSAENINNETRKVRKVKFIDFQEMRYSTPAIDLSFFMYINIPENIRYDIWFNILTEYHSQMICTLTNILESKGIGDNCEYDIESILNTYGFKNFYAHFGRYAIYGVLICMHFLPWLLCSEEECELLSKLFETDMHGKEFYKISMEAGGDDVNMRIFEIIKHANRFGYFNNL